MIYLVTFSKTFQHEICLLVGNLQCNDEMCGMHTQVWSNGKIKKVRGRPTSVSEGRPSTSHCVSMTLLLTLPLDSTVSPLTSLTKAADQNLPENEASKPGNNEESSHYDPRSIEKTTSNESDDNGGEDHKVFNSFSFEDYAWRVYHERLILKDPLDRYRILVN